MTVITYVSHVEVAETAQARIARIAESIIDSCVYVPAGQTHGIITYPSSKGRVVVDHHYDPFGIRMEDAQAIVEAVRDSHRVVGHRNGYVVGVCNWMSHILYRGFGVAAHDRRVAYRAALIRAVR